MLPLTFTIQYLYEKEPLNYGPWSSPQDWLLSYKIFHVLLELEPDYWTITEKTLSKVITSTSVLFMIWRWYYPFLAVVENNYYGWQHCMWWNVPCLPSQQSFNLHRRHSLIYLYIKRYGFGTLTSLWTITINRSSLGCLQLRGYHTQRVSFIKLSRKRS